MMTRCDAQLHRRSQDGRAVYLDGGRVEDVTSHPAFAGAVRSVAQLFDLAHDPANREMMTFPSPRDGRPVNKSWMVPRSREDLKARREAPKCWSDVRLQYVACAPRVPLDDASHTYVRAWAMRISPAESLA
jgi:4-hydroxyphenylacetate 3-monooxygenase